MCCGSSLSISHLIVGVLGLEMCATVSAFTRVLGIGIQVLTLGGKCFTH